MWRGRAKRSVRTMLNHTLRTAAVVAAVALVPTASASAAGKTETLRFFSQTEKLVLTHADGTVVDKAPLPEAVAGDTLDIYAVDYEGNHARHAKRATGSEHVVCTFTSASPEPDCISHVALGGSLLIFRGFPGTLIGGAGRYLGATGRVISNKEVDGGSDVVAKITLR
jgi:hypothetical protein